MRVKWLLVIRLGIMFFSERLPLPFIIYSHIPAVHLVEEAQADQMEADHHRLELVGLLMRRDVVIRRPVGSCCAGGGKRIRMLLCFISFGGICGEEQGRGTRG
jgi:hypothetical protein